MIQFPPRRVRYQNYWKIATIALLFIIILVTIFLSIYWYIFGTRNPFKASTYVRPATVYVAPQYRLGHIIKDAFIVK